MTIETPHNELLPLGRIIDFAPADYLYPNASFPWWGYEVTLALHKPGRILALKESDELPEGCIFISKGGGAWLIENGELLDTRVRMLNRPIREWIRPTRGKKRPGRKAVITVEILVTDLSDFERFCRGGEYGWSYRGKEIKRRRRR